MKAMLTSSGIVTEELLNETLRLCGKPAEEISVAIIDEASKVEFGDKRWIARHYNDAATYFGGQLEIVDLQALTLEEVARKINPVDIIYVLGGDSDYLMTTYVQTGFADLLKELLKTKLYIGSSAGAMVMGQRADSDVYKTLFDEPVRTPVDQYLEFVDYILFPHFDDEDFPNVSAEPIQKVFDVETHKFFAPTREQAIVIEDETISFVGGKPFGNG